MKKKTIYIILTVAAAALIGYGVYRKKKGNTESDGDGETGKPAGSYGGLVLTPVAGGISTTRRSYPKAAATSTRPVSFSMYRRLNKVPSFTLAGENKLSK